MTFSIQQALEAFFNNTGGTGVLYGGTGTGGNITGNPTGGSGTGSSYPVEGTPPGTVITYDRTLPVEVRTVIVKGVKEA